MKKVSWRAVFRDGKIINEIEENGKYNNFKDLDKSNLIYFSLLNNTNNSLYTINLLTGELLLGSIPINPSFQCNFRNDIVFTHRKINYGNYLFWYNESIAEFNGSSTSESFLENVFFGYEIPLSIPHCIFNMSGVISGFKLLVSINVNNNKIYLSQTTYFKTNVNGKEIIYKI